MKQDLSTRLLLHLMLYPELKVPLLYCRTGHNMFLKAGQVGLRRNRTLSFYKTFPPLHSCKDSEEGYLAI